MVRDIESPLYQINHSVYSYYVLSIASPQKDKQTKNHRHTQNKTPLLVWIKNIIIVCVNLWSDFQTYTIEVPGS